MSAHDVNRADPPTETEASTAVLPEIAEPRHLPMFRVILHNDDVNAIEDVVESIVVLTPLHLQEAIERTLEAHVQGLALLLIIHKERAELYVEQFRSRGLTVTIEPDD